MPELASLSLRFWKLQLSAELAWDDDEQPERPTFHHLDPLEVPELELPDTDDDPEDRGLGFT